MRRCKRIKTKVRASLIRRLDSNSGMADALTFYHVNYGDWRKMFTGIDDIDKVTADDVFGWQAISDSRDAHRGLHGSARRASQGGVRQRGGPGQ